MEKELSGLKGKTDRFVYHKRIEFSGVFDFISLLKACKSVKLYMWLQNNFDRRKHTSNFVDPVLKVKVASCTKTFILL